MHYKRRFEDGVHDGGENMAAGSSVVLRAYSLETHISSHLARSGNRKWTDSEDSYKTAKPGVLERWLRG